MRIRRPRNRKRSAPRRGAYAKLRAGLLADPRIGLVIDAGASRGSYARHVREWGYAGSILSVEPLPEPFADLSQSCAGDPLWECRQVALGSQAGSAEMSVAGNSASSSLLPMTETHESAAPKSRVVGTQAVDVVRLDDLGLDPDVGIFLKCDLQGYELEALRGGTRTLEQAVALELELSLRELYAGQSLIDEVLAYVMQRGFRCVGLERAFRDQATRHWLQVDALFVRPDELRG